MGIMRVIDSRCLATMASPARHVFPLIPKAILAIAPERKGAFLARYKRFKLRYEDDHRWILNVDPSAKTIRLSRKVVEVAWAATYAYLALEPIRADARKRGVFDVDYATIPEAKSARGLLKWALEGWLNGDPSPWPAHLPQPQPGDLDRPERCQVLCGCLGALVFLLLHELAHISLGHSQTSCGPEQERDADYEAIDFLLDQCPDDRFRRSERGCVCAMALMLIVARDAHTNRIHSDTHPPSYDRLVHSLRRHFPDDKDTVWHFTSGIFSLHLSNSRLAGKREEDMEAMAPCASPYEAVERDADILSRLPANSHPSVG